MVTVISEHTQKELLILLKHREREMRPYQSWGGHVCGWCGRSAGSAREIPHPRTCHWLRAKKLIALLEAI